MPRSGCFGGLSWGFLAGADGGFAEPIARMPRASRLLAESTAFDDISQSESLKNEYLVKVDIVILNEGKPKRAHISDRSLVTRPCDEGFSIER